MRCIHPTHSTASRADGDRNDSIDLETIRNRLRQNRRLLALTGVLAILGAMISAAVSFAILMSVTPIVPDQTTTLTLITINAGFVLLLIGLIVREIHRIYVARQHSKAAVDAIARHRRRGRKPVAAIPAIARLQWLPRSRSTLASTAGSN